MDVVRLREYREQTSLSLQRMADRINELAPASEPVSASMVDRWEQGTIPRQENMRRLHKATAGQVTFADFYGEEAPKRRSRDLRASIVASRKAAATVARRRNAAP